MAKSAKTTRGRGSKTAVRAGNRGESWLTAAERKLLDGTLGRGLAEASQKQLQATVARARTLRDKWRDLFARQMKAAKRTPQRGDQVNSRSLDKAELFAAAVRRVEARLVELIEGVPNAAASLKPAAKKAAARKAAGGTPTRKKTTARRPATSKKKAAKKRSPARAAAAGEAAAGNASSVRGGTASGGEETSKKARQAGKRKVAAAAAGAVEFDRGKQRSARASATAARIKFDGLSTRRRGHTLVAGKRKQGRRDGRG
jgi:hypothetical protein